MRYDIATKAQAMTLKVFGASNQEIENITGIKQRTMAYIYDRAVQRGFDPNAEHPTLRDYHFAEAPRSGRPRKDESKGDVDGKADEKVWRVASFLEQHRAHVFPRHRRARIRRTKPT